MHLIIFMFAKFLEAVLNEFEFDGSQSFCQMLSSSHIEMKKTGNQIIQ